VDLKSQRVLLEWTEPDEVEGMRGTEMKKGHGRSSGAASSGSSPLWGEVR
jgi:hypothetical protein